MNQIAFPVQDSVHCIGDISADLTHPKSIGAGCYARDLHSPTRQIQEKQDQEPLQALGRPDLDREEIRGHNQLPVLCQELFPSGFAASLWCWFDPVAVQYV